MQTRRGVVKKVYVVSDSDDEANPPVRTHATRPPNGTPFVPDSDDDKAVLPVPVSDNEDEGDRIGFLGIPDNGEGEDDVLPVPGFDDEDGIHKVNRVFAVPGYSEEDSDDDDSNDEDSNGRKLLTWAQENNAFTCSFCHKFSFRMDDSLGNAICYGCEAHEHSFGTSVLCDTCGEWKPGEAECLHCAMLEVARERLRFNPPNTRARRQKDIANQSARGEVSTESAVIRRCRHCNKQTGPSGPHEHKKCQYCSKQFCPKRKTGWRATACPRCVQDRSPWNCTKCDILVATHDPRPADMRCDECKLLCYNCGMVEKNEPSGFCDHCEAHVQ